MLRKQQIFQFLYFHLPAIFKQLKGGILIYELNLVSNDYMSCSIFLYDLKKPAIQFHFLCTFVYMEIVVMRIFRTIFILISVFTSCISLDDSLSNFM